MTAPFLDKLAAMLAEYAQVMPGTRLDIGDLIIPAFNYSNLRLTHLRFVACEFQGTQFGGLDDVSFDTCKFRDCRFEPKISRGFADLAAVSEVTFFNSEFYGTRFTRISLSRVRFHACTFGSLDLRRCRIAGPLTVEESKVKSETGEKVGPHKIVGWETCSIKKTDPSDIEVEFGPHSPFCARRYLSWHDIKWLQALPVLSVSSFLTALLFVYFTFAGELRELTGRPMKALCAKGKEVSDALEAPAYKVLGKLHEPVEELVELCQKSLETINGMFSPGPQYVCLLIATLALLAAATITAIHSPGRLREYSLDAWQYQLGRATTQYVPLAYIQKWWAFAAKTLFLVAAALLIGLLLWNATRRWFILF